MPGLGRNTDGRTPYTEDAFMCARDQLEEKLKEKIDASYRDKVTLSEQQDAFLEYVACGKRQEQGRKETVHVGRIREVGPELSVPY